MDRRTVCWTVELTKQTCNVTEIFAISRWCFTDVDVKHVYELNIIVHPSFKGIAGRTVKTLNRFG
jgi:hypothetical protein